MEVALLSSIKSGGSRGFIGTIRRWFSSADVNRLDSDRQAILEGDGRTLSCFIAEKKVLGRRWWKQGTLSLGPMHGVWSPAFGSGGAIDISSGFRLVRVRDLDKSDWNVKRWLFQVVVLEALGDRSLELAVPKSDVRLVTDWLVREGS